MSKPDPNELDTDVLSPYLESHVEGFHGLKSVKKFSGGQSNPTYQLVAESGNYVLRAKPPGTLLKSAHQVDREYKVMRALYSTPVPVPKMLHLSDENSPIGRMFFIMEMLEGTVYWDPALSELGDMPSANPKRTAIYDCMNRALANLHDVDVTAVGLSDFGVAGNYFERQLSRWSKQYLASETEKIIEIDNLIKWLENNMPPDDGQIALVHGDYRLDNLMFAKERTNILGILDWELSTLGHPLADLAYQCMQWRLPHQGGFRGLGGVNRGAIGLPHEKKYVADYCHRRKIESIDNWSFYLAFSFFRLAAILQGVYKRAVDGNASNPERAKQYGAAVPIMGSLAIQMLDEEF